MGETERDYFNRIEDAAARMTHLIVSLLNYSKISSGAPMVQEVFLSEVMDEVLSDLEILISESQARVRTVPLPFVRANRFQMRQLFQNMISNAVKYSRKDVAPEITISCEISDRHLLIGFQDNGIGFDEKYAGLIFKPFQRLHGREEYQGTGMGLAICDKIVRLHGGEIHAASVPGQGSKFIVDLPSSIIIAPSKLAAVL